MSSAIDMLMRCGERQAAMADDYTAPPTMRGSEVADQGEYLAATDHGVVGARTTYVDVMGCEDVG